jgi:hypothetical protein
MMTIPHVNVAFGDLPERLKVKGEEVLVPRQILTRLLDLYISCWDFDEDWYLASYPDIQQAVNEGLFPSGWAHFRNIGYFEGRLGHQPVVDAEWYLNTYPDIAQAMLEGKVASPVEHFVKHGYAEGRLPHDPGLDVKWYASHYVPSVVADTVDKDDLLRDFVKRGYRQLAIPAPPR